MNFNLVEIYNGLLRFNKHILNELAEGLKHLIFFIRFKVLQVLDILIGMVKELILLNIMVNTLE